MYLSFHAAERFVYATLQIPAICGGLPQRLMASVENWSKGKPPAIDEFFSASTESEVSLLHVGSAHICVSLHEREQIAAWLEPLLEALNPPTIIQAP